MRQYVRDHQARPQCAGTDSLGTPSPAAYRRLRDARTLGDAPTSDSVESVRLGIGDLGVGVFASRPLQPGETILQFTGPLMSFSDAIALGEWQCYALQVGPDRQYIDPDAPGRFVNHSCDPNAGVRERSLVVIRNIRPGEEVRFDYSTTMDEDYWEMPCRCGAPYCRGRIRDFRHLAGELQEKYHRLGVLPGFISRLYSRRYL